PFIVEDERMGASHPSEPAKELVGCVLFCLLDVVETRVLLVLRSILESWFEIGHCIHDGAFELRAWSYVEYFVCFPSRRSLFLVVGCDPVLHQCRVPFIGEDCWPQ